MKRFTSELSGTAGFTAASGDSFIARYVAEGVLQWLKSLGDNTAENIYAIATDGDGDISVSGRRATGMLWKLSSEGAVIWEGPGPSARGMALDSHENISLTSRSAYHVTAWCPHIQGKSS